MRMKKTMHFCFAALLLITLTACGGPGESKAEFDGGYIWTSGDKYLSLNEVTASTTQVAKGGMSISQILNLPKYYYVLDPAPSGTLSSDDVQGFFIKGDYEFKYFSLHKFEEKKLEKGERLFENKGAAKQDSPFYFAGEGIEVDKKQADSGYYFKLKSPLAPGSYVGWLGTSFWIIEIE